MGLDMFLEKRKNASQEVGYWRKANAIHNWFVENVQNGEDDCWSYAVTKEQIEELLELCKEVKKNCELVDGKILLGRTLKDGKWEDEYGDGKVIKDASFAKTHLPTRAGFFFGDTDYDEYYLEGINDTIDILTRVLQETDFDNETIYYSSSW